MAQKTSGTGSKRGPSKGTMKYKKPYIGRQPTEADVERIADRAIAKVTGKPLHPGTNPSVEHNPDVKREDIKRIISESLYWYYKPCVRTDEECAERLDEFFKRVTETGEIPTWEKVCLALGTYREVVSRWERGDLGEQRSFMVKKAREIMASLDAALVSENKIPQITYIFRSKNYYGMQDKTEVMVTPNTQISTADPEQLKGKYLEAAETLEV